MTKQIVEIRLSIFGQPGSITMPMGIEVQTFEDIHKAIADWMYKHDERGEHPVIVKPVRRSKT